MAKISWHSLTIGKTIEQLKSIASKGLSEIQVNELTKKHGYNEIQHKKGRSKLDIFIGQFKNLLVMLLIAAIGISLLVGEIVDAVVIAIIVIANALLGFFQEYRAEKAMEALKKMSAPLAIVIRDGKEQKIPAKLLVPGDIIILAEGDRIPATGRLIESFSLQTDESALTGESTPVQKIVDVVSEKSVLADRKNMVFMDTIVTYGRGKAIIVATGMNTEIGKVAKLIQDTKEKETPLQKKLSVVGKYIGLSVIIIAGIIFDIGLLRGGRIFDILITSIALAVAAVPEGLPAVVTITLALGLNRMAKSKALIRKLPAVETLGATTVICSDKTGTLTKNEMTVQKIYASGKFFKITGEGYEPKGDFFLGRRKIQAIKDKTLNLLLTIGSLCNTARLRKNKRWEIFGDPTEAALLVTAKKAGMDKDTLTKKYKHIGEIPFDSKRKLMTICYDTPTHKSIAYVKGAPEILLKKCTHIFKEGKVTKITAYDRRDILNANTDMAKSALRVLGMAYRVLPPRIKHFESKNIEEELVFVGLQGMMDPPRKEVRDSIILCKKAGIRPIMITGDYEITAIAIAKELLILDGQEVITGAELDKLNERDFSKRLDKISVYARVSPEHKVRILKAWQKKGAVVAMTGDGVNDAPALKNADIGVSMGIVGTDVAKEASAMVLQDDNFSTIVSAIKEGRGVYDNIKNFIRYLLSSNVGEVLTILTASLMGFPLPLIAVQILWMNLLTDGVPALALGVDPPASDIMSRKPRSLNEKTIDKQMWGFISIVGIVMMIGTVGIFSKFLGYGIDYARSMAFSTIVLFQMWNVFNSRTNKSIFSKSLWNNKWLILAVISSVILQILVVYVPFFNPIFQTAPIKAIHWLWIILVSFSIVIVIEILKKIEKARLKN